MAVLAPLASPALHRPLRDPQRGSDLPALRPTLEASNSLEPDPLPCAPLGVSQASTLRISHLTRTTEATCALSGEQPDITRSSSVAIVATLQLKGKRPSLDLATVLDCFSRKVVGWSIAGHMRTGLVTDALRMAASTRGGLDGAVFHSDHGSRAFADPTDFAAAVADVPGAPLERDAFPGKGSHLLAQLLLVALDDHDVVGVAAEQLVGVVALGVQRVAGDHGAGQVSDGLQQRL